MPASSRESRNSLRQLEQASARIGTFVRKQFRDQGFVTGKITAVLAGSPIYFVCHFEDGRSEDMLEEELLQLLEQTGAVDEEAKSTWKKRGSAARGSAGSPRG